MQVQVAAMTSPIVFISHSRVREGQLSGLKRFMAEGTKLLDAAKPRTLVFLAYLDETESELTIVHAFADAESMDAHMEGVVERSAAASEFIESRGFEIYGRPSEPVRQMMAGAAVQAGTDLKMHPKLVGGFLRAQAGARQTMVND
jgi:hypothetical protein